VLCLLRIMTLTRDSLHACAFPCRRLLQSTAQ
jgi:hypothetical protein